MSYFADPKQDMAFKKIFGEEGHQEIVKSFLNSILADSAKIDTIIKVEYAPSELLPGITGERKCIIDVHCKDQDGQEYIVEMQVVSQPYFTKRSLYYVSKAISRQLSEGDDYDKVQKVYFVSVVNFVLFPYTTDYITHHAIFDRKHKTQETHPWVQYSYVELPKFKKTDPKDADTDADRWTMFFSQAQEAGILGELATKVEQIKQACLALDKRRWSEFENALYESEVKKDRDARGALLHAIEKGLAEGIEKGMAQGIEKGIEKGKEEAKVETAKNLLEMNLPIEKISQATGLTIETVEKLKKKI